MLSSDLKCLPLPQRAQDEYSAFSKAQLSRKIALMWHSLTETWPIVFSLGIGNVERDYG